MSSNSPDKKSEGGAASVDVAELIRDLQVSLKRYVASLLGGMDGVDDLVQETNIFLWERQGEVDEDTNFRAWAMRVAWFKVMAERRDRAREKRVVFSEEMLERISLRLAEAAPEVDVRMEALRHCLGKVRLQDRKVLEWKYVRQASLVELAQTLGCSENSIHKNISRLRLALRACVEKQLKRK